MELDITTILTAIVTGVLGSGLTFIAALRNARRDDFNKVTSVLQKEDDKLRDRIVDLESKVGQLEVELTKSGKVKTYLLNMMNYVESLYKLRHESGLDDQIIQVFNQTKSRVNEMGSQ